ncbi:MAG TPA: glycosyltransferase family 4 protein [Sphingobacteriaceae bacterium]|nr:glycosyltransferase family 4 protein [Sphingobacteriaceae bacterium]
MEYLMVMILLFVAELFYFQVADRFNIIDRPNERSSHSRITLRGGGVIFYVAALFYFIMSGFQYPYFFLGLTMMTLVSFMDDVMTLSNKVRLMVHFLSVGLLAYELHVFDMPWFMLLVLFVVAVGVINAYNFMDGINGITAAYSLAVCGLLMWVNKDLNFVDQNLLAYTMIGLGVFTFFNFRKRAKCFAGDVGAVAISFILLFALGALIFQSGNFIYILFLAVYGVDTIWTIVRRLYLRENIFQAHRSHLYQYLGNEAGVNKLLVSFSYGASQFLIGWLVIESANHPVQSQWLFALGLLSGMSVFYLVLKSYIIRRFVY